MLLSVLLMSQTSWVTVVVCCIVGVMLFLRIIKFWLKLILLVALIFFIGRCYFNKKSPRRSAYNPTELVRPLAA
jgi:uncharacterized membrane protein YfcA